MTIFTPCSSTVPATQYPWSNPFARSNRYWRENCINQNKIIPGERVEAWSGDQGRSDLWRVKARSKIKRETQHLYPSKQGSFSICKKPLNLGLPLMHRGYFHEDVVLFNLIVTSSFSKLINLSSFIFLLLDHAHSISFHPSLGLAFSPVQVSLSALRLQPSWFSLFLSIILPLNEYLSKISKGNKKTSKSITELLT